MKIDNGANVGTQYINFITISNDDVNWNEFIKKSFVYSIQGVENENGFYVNINYSNNITKEFLISDVTNQATWTNDQSGLNTALADIISWL